MKKTLYIESVLGPVNFCYESDNFFLNIKNVSSKNTEQMLTELSQADIDPEQVVLNIGPGSFTAIRTVVAIAKALFFKTNKEIYTCQTFELIAFSLNIKEECAIIIDAFQEEFLIGFGGSRAHEIHQVKSFKARDFLLSQGELTTYCYQNQKIKNQIENLQLGLQSIEITSDSNSAFKLAEFFKAHKNLFKTLDWISISPLYFKKSAAEEKLK